MENEKKARGFLKAMKDKNLLHPSLNTEVNENYMILEDVLIQLLEHVHYVAIRDFEMMNGFDNDLPTNK